ncbi:AP-3 complex subunit beta [Paramarasmius palmivorus]|uniref:AP-3 complex subunit beta n=1 Tax=Paramarasmius palmivorus TaxID=297713 RepID=A0AAW0CZI9_9AGAR
MSSGADYLNTITENATRLRQRVQESLSEHTRDIRLTNGYFDVVEDKPKIRKQLDSSSDREKLDAMKKLVALVSKGRNVSEYFAQVVKNVASHNLEIRKLVYIYLLKYAEQEPDLALLSINTFQKDLSDSNPLIRAMALRVLSGIKVPMIGNVVVLAIKKCAADVSPYVRKVAALSTCRCYDLDNSHVSSLIEIITNLLRDRSPLSIGSVAIAFEYVCPTRLDLLHQHYRRLCRTLVDVDEWGQVELMNLLLRYARTMLPRPLESGDLNPDVKLLLDSVEPLFQSRNAAVVLAATRVYWYAGLPSHHPRFVQPLLRLLQTSKEVERVVLAYMLVIARTASTLFSNFYSRFFLFSQDLQVTKRMKLAMLMRLVDFDNHQAILRELIEYSEDPEDEVVSDSISAIGKCAVLIPECTQQCLTALIGMIESNHDVVVGSAVIVLKNLIQRRLMNSGTTHVGPSQTPLKIISQLARKIDDIRHPTARACIIWLVGQYAASDEPSPGPPGITSWAPDVLRKTAKTFGQEASSVKVLIVLLATKLIVLSPEDTTLKLLARYVYSLARYDLNYDVRDRSRMLSTLIRGILPTSTTSVEDEEEDQGGVVLRREQLKLVLFEGKGPIIDDGKDTFTHGDSNAPIGSLGLVTGKSSWTDTILPDWLEQGVESSLRDSPDDAPPPPPVPLAFSSAQPVARAIPSPVVLTPTTGTSPAGSGIKSARGPWTDLDKFYEESSSEEGEEEEEEEEENDGEEDEDEVGESEEESEEEDEESDSNQSIVGEHKESSIQDHDTTDRLK